MVSIWVWQRKGHSKHRKKVIKFGIVKKKTIGIYATERNPVKIALIEWGEVAEHIQKLMPKGSRHKGMLYDVAVFTKTRGWVGRASSMGSPREVAEKMFDTMTSP
jgi:hypothetical protein